MHVSLALNTTSQPDVTKDLQSADDQVQKLWLYSFSRLAGRKTIVFLRGNINLCVKNIETDHKKQLKMLSQSRCLFDATFLLPFTDLLCDGFISSEDGLKYFGRDILYIQNFIGPAGLSGPAVG